MDTPTFNIYVDRQIDACRHILVNKAQEYATDDRLHNFRVAAELHGTTMASALAGMMAKHSVSVYDMCKDPGAHNMEVWDEKLTDHINYLLLLRAVVAEEAANPTLPVGVPSAADIAQAFDFPPAG